MNAIERLLEEVSVVAREDVSRQTFHQALLERFMDAVRAPVGTMWVADGDGDVRREIVLKDGAVAEPQAAEFDADARVAVQRVWTSTKSKLTLPDGDATSGDLGTKIVCFSARLDVIP